MNRRCKCACIAWALCASLLLDRAHSAPFPDQLPQVLLYENVNDGLGTYSFRFDTSDGSSRSESGEQTSRGLMVSGIYAYTAPDGTKYVVRYTADDTGFHPHVQIEPRPAVTTPIPSAGFAAPLPAAALASLLG